MLKMRVFAVVLLAVTSWAGAAMVVQNGDFQTGDLTGWWTLAYQNIAVVQANAGPAGAGDYAVFLASNYALTTDLEHRDVWPSGFKPGKQYTLQFDMKNQNSGRSMDLWISDPKSKSGGLAVSHLGDIAIGAGWVTQSLNFVAPASGSIWIQVTGYNDGPRNFYLDNIQFIVPGDFNRDGAVNDGDYTVWADYFKKSPPTKYQHGKDASGGYNDADYTNWADYFYNAGGNVVPEPFALSFLALGGLAMLKRRRGAV